MPSPLCIPRKYAKILSISLISAIIIASVSSYLIGIYNGYRSMYIIPSNITPTIDGQINANEWGDSEVIITQYVDGDQLHGDDDTFDYMCVGQDQDYLYLSLDLCNDVTDDDEESWIGALLNNGQSFNGIDSYLEALGNGTESLFYNLETNELIGNLNQSIWNRKESRKITSVPISGEDILLNYGIPADMNEWEYYQFTDDWDEGIQNFDDGIAYMLYGEQVNYSVVSGIHLNLQILDRIFKAIFGEDWAPEDVDTSVSYVDFNFSINIWDYFPQVPLEYRDMVARDMKLTMDIALIPMHTYNYTNPPPTEERADQMRDAFEIGVHSYMRNDSIDLFYQLMSFTDVLIGHDDLLTDGPLLKHIDENPYDLWGGFFGGETTKYQINFTDIILNNSGLIAFNVFCLNAFEDLLTGNDMPMGYAIDYAVLNVETSDSLDLREDRISTISNAVVAHSFGTSANSNIPHKMIEIAIPKSELTNFGDQVSVMIVGYTGDSIDPIGSIGYSLISPGDNPNLWFSAVNSGMVNGTDYFISDNYYVIPLEWEE